MPRGLLLTSTFYGTWLPGDRRGFVGRVRDVRPDDPATPTRVTHDQFGTPCDGALPGLHHASVERLRGEPVYLDGTAAGLEAATLRWMEKRADKLLERWYRLYAPDAPGAGR